MMFDEFAIPHCLTRHRPITRIPRRPPRLFCFRREQVSRFLERVDRGGELLHERLVRRIERGEPRAIEGHGLTEQEAEVLRAGLRLGDVVAAAVDGRGRGLDLRQPDAAFRVAEAVAHDGIRGRGIAELDGRRLRRGDAVAHPARERAQAGLDERVMRRGIHRRPASLAAIERRRLFHDPARRLSMRRPGKLPSAIARTLVLARQVRPQRDHVAFGLQIEDRHRQGRCESVRPPGSDPRHRGRVRRRKCPAALLPRLCTKYPSKRRAAG